MNTKTIFLQTLKSKELLFNTIYAALSILFTILGLWSVREEIGTYLVQLTIFFLTAIFFGYKYQKLNIKTLLISSTILIILLIIPSIFIFSYIKTFFYSIKEYIFVFILLVFLWTIKEIYFLIKNSKKILSQIKNKETGSGGLRYIPIWMMPMLFELYPTLKDTDNQFLLLIIFLLVSTLSNSMASVSDRLSNEKFIEKQEQKNETSK